MKYLSNLTAKINVNNSYFICIFILTLIGFFLRIYKLNQDPFWVDEVISVLASQGLVKHGTLLLPSGELYLRAPLSTYTIATSIYLFGNNEFAARLPSVILGTLTIPLTYILGKKVVGKDVALMAALFISLSFFEVAWSRQARMYQFYQFFFLLTITAYTYFKLNQKLIYAALLLVGLVGTYFSHVTWKILLPVILIDLLLNTSIKNKINDAIRYSVISAIIIFIAAVIFFEHPILPSWIYGTFTKEVTEITYWSSPSDFFKNRYTILWWFAIIGSLFLPLKNWKNGTIVVVSFWVSLFALSYYGAALGIGGWWPRYLYFVIPFFLLLSAVGICTVSSGIAKSIIGSPLLEKYFNWEKLKISKNEVNILILASFLVFIVLTSTVPDIGLKLNNNSEIDEPQPNYRDAAQLIKTDVKDQDIIISNRPQLVYYYLGRIDYKGNTEYTIEKDGNKFDLYTGANAILNEEHLKQIINENQRGWIIFNPYMKLEGKEWIEGNLNLYGEIPSTLDDQVVYIYTWGTQPTTPYSVYFDDFDTDRWNTDKFSSSGIDRSVDMIVSKESVIYPINKEEKTYVKYHFNFSKTPNKSIIIATGNRRHVEHNLSVWVSSDNKKYTKLIEYEETRDITKQADITNFIQNNQTWIEFRFFRSSKGDNTPRILDFSITATPQKNQIIEITPFGINKHKSSDMVSYYNFTNLLSQHSFENYKDSRNPPLEWSFISSNAGTADIDSTGFDGNYSYRVSVQNARDGFADMSQTFDLNENEYYRLNATHKQSGSGNAILLVQWFDENWEPIKQDRLNLPTTDKWMTNSIEEITPPNTKHGKVILRYETKSGDSGIVWFDDIKLQVATNYNGD